MFETADGFNCFCETYDAVASYDREAMVTLIARLVMTLDETGVISATAVIADMQELIDPDADTDDQISPRARDLVFSLRHYLQDRTTQNGEGQPPVV